MQQGKQKKEQTAGFHKRGMGAARMGEGGGPILQRYGKKHNSLILFPDKNFLPRPACGVRFCYFWPMVDGFGGSAALSFFRAIFRTLPPLGLTMASSTLATFTARGSLLTSQSGFEG